MAIIRYRDLSKIRKKFKDKKIVFCSGSFSIVHAGHVLFLEDCKKYGDILVVSVGNDAILARNKKGRPTFLNEHMRLKIIDSLKPVDYTFLDLTNDKQHVQTIVKVAFQKLRPDFNVINEDATDIPFRKNLAKKYGVKMKILSRWCPPEYENISASKLIDKIKRS